MSNNEQRNFTTFRLSNAFNMVCLLEWMGYQVSSFKTSVLLRNSVGVITY